MHYNHTQTNEPPSSSITSPAPSFALLLSPKRLLSNILFYTPGLIKSIGGLHSKKSLAIYRSEEEGQRKKDDVQR